MLLPRLEQLRDIASKGDQAGLESLIRQELETVDSVAAELNRFTVAEQNTRAAGVQGDTLEQVVKGLRTQQEVPVKLFRENIVDLLS